MNGKTYTAVILTPVPQWACSMSLAVTYAKRVTVSWKGVFKDDMQ